MSHKKTFAVCKFEHFSEIAKADKNSSKWIGSKPFSLDKQPNVQFCVMYNVEKGRGSLYLEPLNLGPYESMKARVTIDSEGISRTVSVMIHHQSLDGHGWSNFFASAAASSSLILSDTLTVTCTIEVLEVKLKTTKVQDHTTSCDWQIASFKDATKDLGLQTAFEFSSPAFSLDGHPDLELQLLFKKRCDSQYAQLQLVPANMMSAKARLNVHIWIEDRRTGLRLFTWFKEMDFDFSQPKGLVDTQFVLFEELCRPSSPFLNLDGSLSVHCRIYHNSSTVVQESAEPTEDDQNIATNLKLPIEHELPESAIDECFKFGPLEESDEEFPLPAYTDFQVASMLSKCRSVKPKAAHYSMQELSNVLTEMRMKQTALNQRFLMKFMKTWSNEKPDPIELTPEPISVNSYYPTPKMAQFKKKQQIGRVFGHFTEKSVKYSVERAGKGESNVCEFRSQGKVFKIQVADLTGKCALIDRVLSKLALENDRKLVFKMNNYHHEGVNQFVNFLDCGDCDYLFSNLCYLTQIAEDFELPELKENCAKKFIEKMNVQDVCIVLTFAIRLEMIQVADKAIGFAAKHYDEIRNWSELCSNDPKLSSELRSLIREVRDIVKS